MTTDPPAPKPKKRRGPAKSRSTGRLAAVQALYQIDVTHVSPDAVVADFLLHRLEETVDDVPYHTADRTHFETVVRGVSLDIADVDDMVTAVLSEDWSVPRLEPLLRAVMRAGTFELAYMVEVPPRVVIAEYVAVAQAFFSEREPAMVNGVLDAIARALRPEELEQGAAPPSADQEDTGQAE